MTAKVINIPALPAGLTVSFEVRNSTTGALLETVASTTYASGLYSGTITGAHAGRLLFVIMFSGGVAEHRVMVIEDTAGPWLLLTESGLIPTNGGGPFLIDVLIDDGTDPVEGALMRLQRPGFNITRESEVDGTLEFGATAGTYDVVIVCPGFDSIETTLTITGNASITYSLDATAFTPSGSPLLSTGLMTMLNEFGVAEVGVKVSLRKVLGNGVSGYGRDSKIREATSIAGGVLEFTGLERGCKYEIWRGANTVPVGTTFAVRTPQSKTSFIVPNAASFNLPEILGEDE